MSLGPHFKGFWVWWTLVGLETARSNLGQTLVNPGQTWSTLVKLSQTSPNSGKCILGHVSRVFGHSGPPSGQKRLGQPLVKLGQPWSNLANPSQTWSNFGEICPRPSSWGYLMWRALARSCRFGSGCLDLRVDSRENPWGKNGVMTASKALSNSFFQKTRFQLEFLY